MTNLKIIGNSLYGVILSIVISAWYSSLITLCSTVFAIIFISLMRFVYLPADCDMVLHFYDHFGKKVDSLNGKVIWITGASTGIGKVLALALSKGKVKLVLSARSEDKLQQVKEKCIEEGNLGTDDVLVIPFDMTNCKEHEAAFDKVIKVFGQLDILVSNAGRSQRADWEKIEMPVDEAMFSLNTFSLMNLARIVTRHFLEVGKGHHVVMSSVAGKMGVPMSGSYCGSKHAIMGYFECLRFEKGSKGMTITLLCPGPVESDLMERILEEKLDQKSDKKRTGKMMSGERCAALSVVAIANGVSEAWICFQPVLTLMYLNQYQPTILKWFMNNFDLASVAMKIRDGKSST